MSFMLVVFKGREQVGGSTLGKGMFIIGSDPGSDLQLDDPAISGEHCFIIESQGSYNLRDRGSESGILLNGQKVEDRVALSEGDTISIGPFTIKFMDEEATIAPSSMPAPPQPAAAAAPAPTPDPVPPAAPPPPAAFGVLARLHCESGAMKGDLFELIAGGAITLGRDKENTVVLLDDAASKVHAKVFQEGSFFYIEDMCSSNGTQVNGHRIQKKQLHQGDKVKIGETVFSFDDGGASRAGAPLSAQHAAAPGSPAPAAANRNLLPILAIFGLLIAASVFMAIKLFGGGSDEGADGGNAGGDTPPVATNTVVRVVPPVTPPPPPATNQVAQVVPPTPPPPPPPATNAVAKVDPPPPPPPATNAVAKVDPPPPPPPATNTVAKVDPPPPPPPPPPVGGVDPNAGFKAANKITLSEAIPLEQL